MYAVRGTLTATLVLIWTFILLPIQIVVHRLPGRVSRIIPKIYHRGAGGLIGLQIKVVGQPLRGAPVLYVANHASWLDIVALGSLLEAGFIAKSEVKTWPGIGLLARLQGTMFISRQRLKTRDQADEISIELQNKRRLILFPAGTSNDGRRVLDFRSGYFSVAERWTGPTPLPVQPVSIAYIRHQGLPIGRTSMPSFAWYGDMDLLPHLWDLMCLGGHFQVLVEFHDPVSMPSYASRKELALHCQQIIDQGVRRAHTG